MRDWFICPNNATKDEISFLIKVVIIFCRVCFGLKNESQRHSGKYRFLQKLLDEEGY